MRQNSLYSISAILLTALFSALLMSCKDSDIEQRKKEVMKAAADTTISVCDSEMHVNLPDCCGDEITVKPLSDGSYTLITAGDQMTLMPCEDGVGIESYGLLRADSSESGWSLVDASGDSSFRQSLKSKYPSSDSSSWKEVSVPRVDKPFFTEPTEYPLGGPNEIWLSP
jgi:hypothetical protein